jgi:hypothetical protein
VIRFLRKPQWSPYIVGIGIGCAELGDVLLHGKGPWHEHVICRGGGSAVCTIAPEHVAQQRVLPEGVRRQVRGRAKAFKPIFDWQMALDVALVIGAFLAAWLGGTLQGARAVRVGERFGPSVAKRYAAAFVGGFILIFGARMAGGCTSGHGISGGLQLAVSSWTFFVSMFISGIGRRCCSLAPGRHATGRCRV